MDAPTLGFLLHDVARLLGKRFEQNARGSGLTRCQWQVLAYLAQRTQQPQPISQRPDHLNCGIGGTEMRGGGIGATAGAFCSPIWPCICAEPTKAPLAANPAEPPAESRANAAAGKAMTARIKAIFVARVSWVETQGRRRGVRDFGVGLLAQAGA